MLFRQLFDQDTWSYTYLLADPQTREAVLIDPIIERVDRDVQLLRELGLTLRYTLETHVHADHITGSGKLREALGSKTAVGAAAEVPCVDVALADGQRLKFGRYEVEARSTPGHTSGCMTYVVEAEGETYAFTGDALLVRGCGRTDFQQGDAHVLYRSVRDRIFSLPDDTKIYPAHDYRGHTMSSVEEERAHNPRLRDGMSEEAFVDIMHNLKLADPRLMDVAVPANMACGLKPGATQEPQAPKGVQQRKAQDVVGYLDRYRVVDVRELAETSGDLKPLRAAELVPLATLPQVAAGWDRKQPVLMVCRSGNRSGQAAEWLVAQGFEDVSNLVGGMQTWHMLNLEV